MASTMSTPLNNLPIKSGQANDIQDPLVQDVLKEFEEEIAAAKKPPIYQLPPQQQLQTPPPPPQYHIQPQPPQCNQNFCPISSSKCAFLPQKNLIDFDLARRVLIIVIVVLLLNYSSIFDFIYNKLPLNISSSASCYDMYIRGFSLFITLYILNIYEII